MTKSYCKSQVRIFLLPWFIQTTSFFCSSSSTVEFCATWTWESTGHPTQDSSRGTGQSSDDGGTLGEQVRCLIGLQKYMFASCTAIIQSPTDLCISHMDIDKKYLLAHHVACCCLKSGTLVNALTCIFYYHSNRDVNYWKPESEPNWILSCTLCSHVLCLHILLAKLPLCYI